MKHLIIIKFNESSKVEDLIPSIKQLFEKAKDIEGIKSINIYKSNINLPNRHDLMIEMHLTKKGLENFDNSEIHKRWKEQYSKYIINKTIFDYE